MNDALIATLWDGSPSYEGAIGHWCERAAPLQAALVSAALFRAVSLGVVLTPERGARAARRTLRTDCPSALTLRPSRALRAAAAHFRDVGGGCRHDTPSPSRSSTTTSSAGGTRTSERVPSTYQFGGVQFHQLLLRWHLFSLTEYALVVYADLDVELVRPEEAAAGEALVARRWRHALHEALPPAPPRHPQQQRQRQQRGAPRFLSVGDEQSPLNSGVWTLGWPSAALYERGVELLRAARWNSTHGFVAPTGSIRDSSSAIGDDSTSAAAVGRWSLASGWEHDGWEPRRLYEARADLRRRLRGTAMLRSNSWSYPGGNCDQGFLWHVLYVTPHAHVELYTAGNGPSTNGGQAASGSDAPYKHYYVGAHHRVRAGSRVASLRHSPGTLPCSRIVFPSAARVARRPTARGASWSRSSSRTIISRACCPRASVSRSDSLRNECE